MHILIVNINGLRYTEPLIGDLRDQSILANLTLVDQGSTEPGTKRFLDTLEKSAIACTVVRHDRNVDLCRIWNWFYENTDDKHLCFLNNDVRVPSNFVADTISIFNIEPKVGCVVHKLDKKLSPPTTLTYTIPAFRFVQGCDFTLRKDVYVPIPDDLKIWGGDDWLFHNLYEKNWQAAVAHSSKIIHYGRKSYSWASVPRNADVLQLRKMGLPEYKGKI